MDLGKVSARIRPRMAFEAIDLGFLMVRRWWKPLFLMQTLLFSTCVSVVYLLTRNAELTVGLIWWFKPVFETFHLQFLGRALFDEHLPANEILKHRGAIVFHEILAKLTWRRFHPMRSFIMPVAELEQIKGRARWTRIRLLSRRSRSAGLWITALGSSLEFILAMDVLLAAWIMLPAEITDRIDWNQMANDETLTLAVSAASLVAMFLVMPFYVACGFCLYINRRTWLEGWDIELVFKHLATRLDQSRKRSASMWSIALLVLVTGLSIPSRSTAMPLDGEPAAESRQTPMVTPTHLRKSREDIADILEGEDFHRYETEQVLRPISKHDRHSGRSPWLQGLLRVLETLGSWIAHGTEILMWAGTIMGMLMLARLWPVMRARLRRGSARITRRHAAVYGLAPEAIDAPLPENIPEVAQLEWQAGHTRDALSLLYRGALHSLSRRFNLPLHTSHTEIESVELCQERCPAVVGHYFNRLTQAWMRLAYGHRTISTEEFEDLVRGWAFFEADQQGGAV